MTDDEQGRQAAPLREGGQTGQVGCRQHHRVRTALIAVLVVIIVFVVPPMISIGRYKSRITQIISASFGRPVRLSSVELRLLPWPGFVLTDLSVAEDPAYGAEPVLHANSVTANIRLLPLWRGKLEISSLNVDEASLNVVRAAPGRWNLDPLFRTAAAKAGVASAPAHRFPYLEATNSRINFKDGAEKLPFSLINTDLSFWQESPGEWRLRLRGQPARTDVTLDLGDTGVVRLEASIHRAPELHLMPLHVDLDWREAQLGQLSRLLIGYDPGWRGDLTGELHLDGTPDAAKVTARLSATGVHRAEFEPVSPLDFDANCGFVYHYSRRALDDIVCDSPLGDGRLRLTGDVPGADAASNLTVGLDHIPVGAGLDILRTLRSGIDPGLTASGSISGKLAYTGDGARPPALKPAQVRRGRMRAAPQGPLTGSLTVEGFTLSGGGLNVPLHAPKLVLEPVEIGASAHSNAGVAEALAGTAAIPAGGAAPLTVNLKLALYGYEAGLHGPVSLARAREFVHAAGLPNAEALEGLAGEPMTANLTVEGPWLPREDDLASGVAGAGTQGAGPAKGLALEASSFNAGVRPATDHLGGTIMLHDDSWRADYLAGHVQIAEATLHLGDGALRWDPVAFTYGPVKGTVSVTLAANCPGGQAAAVAPDACVPHFVAEFGALDADALQVALLGVRQKGSLLSDLIDRFHAASAPLWPAMNGTVKADSLIMGPLTLRAASATVKIADQSADFSNLQAGVLGGQVKAGGTVRWAAGDQAAPEYTVAAHCTGLNASAVGQLLAMRWSGGPIKMDGKVDLSGFTAKELAASANGTLHFDWGHGGVAALGRKHVAGGSKMEAMPAALAHFNDWNGDAKIGKDEVTLGKNQLAGSGRKAAVEGAVSFGKPPKVRFELGNQPPLPK